MFSLFLLHYEQGALRVYCDQDKSVWKYRGNGPDGRVGRDFEVDPGRLLRLGLRREDVAPKLELGNEVNVTEWGSGAESGEIGANDYSPLRGSRRLAGGRVGHAGQVDVRLELRIAVQFQ
jgi:hypothetical protein